MPSAARAKAAALSALFAGLTQPALAQEDPRLHEAQQALEQGAPDTAIAGYQALLAERPDDPDLLRRLAVAQAAAGRYDAAITTIDRAAALAPDDYDIRLARARILLWSGRVGAARKEAQVVRRAAPDYPDLAGVEQAIAAAEQTPRRAGIAIAGSLADVDIGGGDQTWKTLGATLYGNLDRNLVGAAGVEWERRRVTDTRLNAALTWLRPYGEFRASIGGTPQADFRDRWSIGAGADLRLTRNAVLIGDIRRSQYDGLNVVAATPGIRFETRARDRALTLRWINIFRSDGDYQTGVSGRIDAELGGDRRVYLGAATYPDTEAGITRQVRSGFVGGALPIGDRLALGLTAEYERREQSYTRKAISLSLTWRFGG